MRVLAATTAGAGHFGPLVPFARACLAAGHDVVVAAPASFAAEVAAAGFQHRPFADAPPDVLGRVFARVGALSFDEANEVVVTEVFGRLDAQAALPGLRDLVADWRPDVVVREPAELGALAAARSAGVPSVTVAIGVGEMLEYLARLMTAPLAELDAAVGLPDGACAAAMRAGPTLTCVPVLLDGAGRDTGRRDGADGPVHRFHDDALTSAGGVLPPAWGDPSLPLVYVSFGSVAAGQPGSASLYVAVLAALADQPVRVLLTTGQRMDPADLGPVPANARVERWWPQRDVMPHAAAVVGHGGFGTTMAALAGGVPQVVVPLFSTDQRANAEHVAAIGAGLHLGGPEAVGDLPAAVASLLGDPAYRTAARAVADEMAALPPVAEAVALLERIGSR